MNNANDCPKASADTVAGLELEFLPKRIQEKLSLACKIYARQDWWKEQIQILEAFKQLAALSISKEDCEPDWRASDTVVRPSEPRPIGTALIHKSARLMPGSVLVGDVIICSECEIGPHCTIFGPTIVGPRSYIGPGAEVRRSMIHSDLTLSHLSYLGHSMVGRRVNLGAGFIVAVRNLRRDTVHLQIESSLYDTGLEHFGAIIADDFYCSINTSVLPGRTLVKPIINSHIRKKK